MNEPKTTAGKLLQQALGTMRLQPGASAGGVLLNTALAMDGRPVENPKPEPAPAPSQRLVRLRREEKVLAELVGGAEAPAHREYLSAQLASVRESIATFEAGRRAGRAEQ